MYLTAETVKVDDDEGRFTLEIVDDEGQRHAFIIHHIDLDAFYDQVKSRIGPYLRERDAAKAEYQQAVSRGTGPAAAAFLCAVEDIDESGGYDVSDPKHPRFHSIHADIHDMRERNPDEYEYLLVQSKREKAGEE